MELCIKSDIPVRFQLHNVQECSQTVYFSRLIHKNPQRSEQYFPSYYQVMGIRYAEQQD